MSEITTYFCLAVADPGFPKGGAPTLGGLGGRRRQHTILPSFPKNCMKLKEFEHPGGGGGGPVWWVPHGIKIKCESDKHEDNQNAMQISFLSGSKDQGNFRK